MLDLSETGLNQHLESAEPCNVLVVDDDDLVASRLVGLLRLGGYHVRSAASGAEALKLLDESPAQIVLTDWEMPDLDGPSLCRALRTRDVQHYTYVILLTVRRNSADVLQGLGAGADDFLVKGASAAELLARIEVGRRIMGLERSLRASVAENRRLALTDPLTGAHNRRSLMKHLARELERSRRYGHPLSLLSCDLDNFKHINDTYGHDAGDEVLQGFVTRAVCCTRTSIDWIARAGGEEFVVVLPETSLDGATRVAEKIRLGLAERPVSTSAGALAVTVSIGATALESKADLTKTTLAELLRAADRCLYASKHHGRNRTTGMPAARAALLGAAAPTGVPHEIN